MKKQLLLLSILVVAIVFSYLLINIPDILNSPSITGRPITSTRLVIVSLTNSSCNMTLEQGWNFVSFPCVSLAQDIPLLLVNISDYYDMIRWYNPADVTDPWKTYKKDLPSWVVQDLLKIERNYGYWIYLDMPTSFFRMQDLGTPTRTILYPGWNMLGWPNQTVAGINKTYSELIPDFDYIYMYNASSSDKWKQWTWNSSKYPSNQDLSNLTPGYGYLIYMFASDELIIT